MKSFINVVSIQSKKTTFRATDLVTRIDIVFAPGAIREHWWIPDNEN